MPGHHVTPFRPANGMQQPHILLNTNNGMQVAEVRVEGPRYWQQTLPGSFLGSTDPPEGVGLGPQGAHTLYVRRKAGALPYDEDPLGVRSLLSSHVHLVRGLNYAST